MTRKLFLLNLALACLAGLLGWYFRQQWLEARRQELKVMSEHVRPVAPPPVTITAAPAPVQAGSYSDIAQKLVFSKDRNPNVEVVVTPPPPMPPLPVAHGVFLFGDAPTVLLSEKAGGPHKGYRPGDTVGEFKLISITNAELEFDWKGKRIKRNLKAMLEEGARSNPPPEVAAAPAAPAQTPAPAPAAAASSSLGGEKPSGPPPGTGVRPCTPGDSTPEGAVVDGVKKVVTATPFGRSCRWEPVN